jgi:hypothetical protein
VNNIGKINGNKMPKEQKNNDPYRLHNARAVHKFWIEKSNKARDEYLKTLTKRSEAAYELLIAEEEEANNT